MFTHPSIDTIIWLHDDLKIIKGTVYEYVAD